MYQLVLKIPEEAPGKAIGAGKAEARKAIVGMKCSPEVDLLITNPRGNKR
ncbi:MAG: hypothetical protein P8Z78_15620 [Gammaproteobacteria bacterium]